MRKIIKVIIIFLILIFGLIVTYMVLHKTLYPSISTEWNESDEINNLSVIASDIIFAVYPSFRLVNVPIEIYCLPDSFNADGSYRSHISFGDGNEMVVSWNILPNQVAFEGEVLKGFERVEYTYTNIGEYLVECQVEYVPEGIIIGNDSMIINVTNPLGADEFDIMAQ